MAQGARRQRSVGGWPLALVAVWSFELSALASDVVLRVRSSSVTETAGETVSLIASAEAGRKRRKVRDDDDDDDRKGSGGISLETFGKSPSFNGFSGSSTFGTSGSLNGSSGSSTSGFGGGQASSSQSPAGANANSGGSGVAAGSAQAAAKKQEAQSAKSDKTTSKSKTADKSDDDDNDVPVPSTLVDLFSVWSKQPKMQPPAAPSVATGGGGAGPAARRQAGDAKAEPAPVAGSAGVTTGAIAGAAAAGAAFAATKGARPGVEAARMPGLQKVAFASSEVLTVNPSAQDIARATALGFRPIATEQVSTVNSKVVRLALPAGWTSAEAQRLLQAELKNAPVLFNHIYRPIAAATQADEALRPNAGGSITGACPRERCYAQQAIAWQTSLAQCTKGMRIGVIDTAIDPDHPALRNQSLQLGALRAADRPAASSHGTGVLALLAGQTDSPTPGLIPNARFFAADIFFADADGAPVSDTVHLLKALEWLDAWDVKVINLSLTGPRDDLVERAIARLVGKGVIIVAAAGNEGPNAPPAFPAAYPAVIAVTAVDRNLRSYRHANQGSYIDVAAPGVEVWTALPNGRQGALTGTSLAAPFAAAMVATIYDSLPRKTKTAVLERLRYTDLGRPGRDPVFGNGLVIAPESCAPTPAITAPSIVSGPADTTAPVVQTSVKRTLQPSGL